MMARAAFYVLRGFYWLLCLEGCACVATAWISWPDPRMVCGSLGWACVLFYWGRLAWRVSEDMQHDPWWRG